MQRGIFKWGGRKRFKPSYFNKVMNMAPANLVGYWPMDESSGIVAIDYSSQANNGAYTGVTLEQGGIGDGRTCPLFDGANDFNNLVGSGLSSDMSYTEFTIHGWIRVSGSSVWTDGVQRRFIIIQVDANNLIQILKQSTNNTITWQYFAGGTNTNRSQAGNSSTDWIPIGIVVSASGNYMRIYANGIQVGADQTVGTWVGTPVVMIIGAGSTTPTTVMDGTLAHVAIFTTP